MKIYILIITANLCCLFSFAQSSLYRSDGRLFADTTCVIDSKRINEIMNFEQYILPVIYNKILYPQVCANNSIEGFVIAEIQIETDTAIMVNTIIYSDIILSNAIKKALNIDFLKSQLTYWNIFKEYPVKFYIPFQFEILPETFRQDLYNTKSVVIKAFSGTHYYEKNIP
jgi:hypothetical protein